MSAKKVYSRMGFATLAFMLVWNGLVLISTIVIAAINEKLLTSNMTLLLNFIIELCVAAPVFYLVAKKVPVSEEKTEYDGKLGKFLFAALLAIFGFGIVGSLVSNVINGLLYSLIKQSSNSGLEIIFNNTFGPMALYAVFFAPCIEEFVFRKLLIDRIKPYGKKMAVIMSGVLFGLMHGNIEQFFYTFLIGMVLAYVYVRTGKIWCSILLHMTLNGTSTILQYCLSKLPIEGDLNVTVDLLLKDTSLAVFLLILIAITFFEYVGGIIGIILVITRRKELAFKPEMVETLDAEGNVIACPKEEVKARDAFINLGMILAILGLIALMVVAVVL